MGTVFSEKWDRRFLDLAAIVSTWSKDPSTKCGSVIVRPNRTIASVGFNGFPMGIDDSECLYKDREEKYKRVVHSEMNAILFSTENLSGFSLYNFPLAPCERCAVHIIQSGIKTVFAPEMTEDQKSRWGNSIALSRILFEESGVRLIEIGVES